VAEDLREHADHLQGSIADVITREIHAVVVGTTHRREDT